MPNFKKLKMLPSPVNSTVLFDTFQKKEVYVQMARNIDELLSPEILKVFADLGVTPEFCGLFGQKNVSSSKIWIHTDLRYVNNQWTKMPFGINWELVPSNSYFTWWDTKDMKECYPPDPENSAWCQPDGFEYGLQGIHYGSRETADTGIAEPLETIKLEYQVPYLVRADIPHSVAYATRHKQRIGLSVRFPLEQVPTWERALEVFEPLFAE